MAVTFHRKITLRPESVFCFGTISSVADEEGTLHRIADLPRKKSLPTNSENIGVRKDRLQQARGRGPADPENSTAYFPDERMDTNRKEERNKQNGEEASCSFRASVLKGERKEDRHDSRTILPRRSFHRESGVAPVSDDEPTAPGEEPPQRESRQLRNRRRNIRRHNEAGERDPEQPVLQDEVSEIGETPEERVFRERRNSRRRDRRRAQEQAEQEATQRRENPLFGRNLNLDFA
jgi:hypothetical protein